MFGVSVTVIYAVQNSVVTTFKKYACKYGIYCWGAVSSGPRELEYDVKGHNFSVGNLTPSMESYNNFYLNSHILPQISKTETNQSQERKIVEIVPKIKPTTQNK